MPELPEVETVCMALSKITNKAIINKVDIFRNNLRWNIKQKLKDNLEGDIFKKPYRRDRNKWGGGVMIYVRNDIPSQEKTDYKLPDRFEGLLIEINLRKTKFLLIGIYHSTNEKYGLKDAIFLHEMGSIIDYYPTYDQFLILLRGI